jgi:alkylation response protein AidB-like acyl-CoA dehydrogenase
VFHDLSHDHEAALIARRMAWQKSKHEAGYTGLLPELREAFDDEEAAFETPDGHEVCSVTVHLVAPTIRAFGTAEQQRRFIPPFVGGEELCCRLFSEPGAGSDLAGVATPGRARR